MTRKARWLTAAAAVAAALAAPRTAAAKSEKTVRWTYKQAWPTAVRFLRIDQRCDILDKDEATGYILFELPDDGKKFRGALEIVKIKDDAGRPALRLVLRLDDRPSYMELGMLDRLERKLRDEHGEPPEPPDAKPKDDDDKPKDGDKPADKDGDRPARKPRAAAPAEVAP